MYALSEHRRCFDRQSRRRRHPRGSPAPSRSGAARRAEELRYLILAAQREGNRLLGRALRPPGLTSSQAEVIRVLHEHRPVGLSGLGDLLVCESGSSPSRLVDRFCSVGLVQRQTSEHDRRSIKPSLTEEGTRLAAQVSESEEHLYQTIEDATRGRDFEQITGFLWGIVVDLPTGRALTRRIESRQPNKSSDTTTT